MNRYTAESCHEVGYGWEIETPENLTENDIQNLIDALVAWTDEPNQSNLQDMLSDDSHCFEYGMSSEKMQAFKKITIECESVHRNAFTQSLEKTKE